MTGSCPVSAHVCQETARERDELRAKFDRLRAGIEALAGDPTWHRGMYGCPRDMVSTDRLIALIQPTEGEK